MVPLRPAWLLLICLIMSGCTGDGNGSGGSMADNACIPEDPACPTLTRTPEDQVGNPVPPTPDANATVPTASNPPDNPPDPRRIGEDGYIVENVTVIARHSSYPMYLIGGKQGDSILHTPSTPIPELTTLLVGLSWEGDFPNCEEAIGPCHWVVVPYRNHTAIEASPRAEPPSGGGYQVVVYDNASRFVDPPGANASTVELNIYAAQCDPATPAAAPEGQCAPQMTEMPPTEVRLRIEAWRSEPDLEAFVQRLTQA